MQVKEVVVTPELAIEWLEKNTSNRPLRRKKIEEYAADIKADKWCMNGSTLVWNGSRLLDGQHRLHAIIEAGTAIRTLVVYDADEDAFATIDTGIRRSGADVLAVIKEDNVNVLAGAIRAMRVIAAGGGHHTYVSNSAVIGEIQMHPSIRDSVRYVLSKIGKSKIISPSMLSGLHYLWAQKDHALANAIVVDLTEGSNLAPGDPVLLLRNRLIMQATARTRMQRRDVYALAIKAWNARRRGEGLGVLRWKPKGDHAELFPTIL